MSDPLLASDVATQSAHKMRLLGTPPPLSLGLALRVALTSIRVRMSRSLVTISSVILAVAFLLSVLGEEVGNRAVHAAWSQAAKPAREAQTLREALTRRRSPRALLALLGTPQRVDAWCQELVAETPHLDASNVATAIELIDWIAALNPSQSYQVARNRTPEEFVLALDASAVTALADAARQLKGVRLDLPREHLDALAVASPLLARALAVLARADDARLDRVQAAGGAEAILQRFADGHDEPILLPIDQLLPGVSDQAIAAIRSQLTRDRARLRTAAAVATANAGDPALPDFADVQWPALTTALAAPTPAVQHLIAASGLTADAFASAAAGDPAGQATALAALHRIITSPGLYRKEAFAGIALPAATEALAKRVRLSDRQASRLGRMLTAAALPGVLAATPPDAALDLRGALLGTAGDPRAERVHASLSAELGPDTLARTLADLDQRARLTSLERTFTALAYDPERTGRRTFWLVVLSLLVCIVGIVNTMMMAVTERFREIATMKCLGAPDSFILRSFLLESGLMGCVGSALGMVAGVLLVIVQGSVRFGSAYWQNLPLPELGAASGLALICGLILAVAGALMPALKAARMHPIEAMRIDA